MEPTQHSLRTCVHQYRLVPISTSNKPTVEGQFLIATCYYESLHHWHQLLLQLLKTHFWIYSSFFGTRPMHIPWQRRRDIPNHLATYLPRSNQQSHILCTWSPATPAVPLFIGVSRTRSPSEPASMDQLCPPQYNQRRPSNATATLTTW